MGYSIIVPTYQSENTLERAVASLLRAAGPRNDIEILVIDDCSLDSTFDIAESLSSRYPQLRCFRTKCRGGPGSARNLGIRFARQNWLLFLDSDDEVTQDCFNTLDQYLAENDKNSQIIAFNAVLINYDSTIIKPSFRDDLALLSNFDNKLLILSAFLRNLIDPSVIFYAFQRSFIIERNILFRSGFHEDVDFMFNSLFTATKIFTIPQTLYLKYNTPGSIVNTLSLQHIDGYFDALCSIRKVLTSNGLLDQLFEEFRLGVINVTASRLVKLVNSNFFYQDDISAILTKLYERSRSLVDDPHRIIPGRLRTKYEMIFSTFFDAFSSGSSVDEILCQIQSLSKKSWSCYDLHNSIFLRPDEIRTCCKRFFYNDQMKGDVTLFHIDQNSNFTYHDILNSKIKLHREINRNNCQECAGCPFLKFDEWGEPLNRGVKYLSLEYHSICNMRCTYCDDNYYGGKKPLYDIVKLIDSFADAGALHEIEYIVWGGGEPVVEKHFSQIAHQLASQSAHVRQRIITNCSVYSETLEKLMKEDRAYIVTSLDAGSESVFHVVRHYQHFDKVLNNLSRYAESSPSNVIIKYIILPENCHSDEINEFVSLIRRRNLFSCNFQISCNFKSEQLSLDLLIASVRLYHLLYKIPVHFQFFDDLIWQRLPYMEKKDYNKLIEILENLGIDDVVARPKKNESIIVWGTGSQAQLLCSKSWFLRNSKITCFIDPRPDKIGTHLFNKPVFSPEILLNRDDKVVIAAVQSAPFIYQTMLKFGVSKDRILNLLLL